MDPRAYPIEMHAHPIEIRARSVGPPLESVDGLVFSRPKSSDAKVLSESERVSKERLAKANEGAHGMTTHQAWTKEPEIGHHMGRFSRKTTEADFVGACGNTSVSLAEREPYLHTNLVMTGEVYNNAPDAVSGDQAFWAMKAGGDLQAKVEEKDAWASYVSEVPTVVFNQVRTCTRRGVITMWQPPPSSIRCATAGMGRWKRVACVCVWSGC